MEDLMYILALGEECRYSVQFIQNSVPKSRVFLNEILWELDENRFKKITRVTWKTFDAILDLIKGDNLFNKIRSGKQFPIKTQLAIVLYRLGSSGEGATLSKIAGLFGISDGGIIQNLTERIFNALLNYKDQYLFWPNTEERKELVLETSSELPNCIGYVDGTEIPLAEKPSQDPEAYFSRKHINSVKAQAVCDHRLQIRHLVLDFPDDYFDYQPEESEHSIDESLWEPNVRTNEGEIRRR
ncbi:protein ALP1-like [Bactrocera tryoni]|uniref:protein ALP1-like n=1 Tax=Bactrocera tryoni TaxID=59916 RepID=UPI001A95B98C|nr:protein ALP1-like [Bactrocera tryoni]